jgi:hypothetical protein
MVAPWPGKTSISKATHTKLKTLLTHRKVPNGKSNQRRQRPATNRVRQRQQTSQDSSLKNI